MKNPPELGLVRWGRDLAAASAESKQTGKPVLLLFQEIPGCQPCVDFGAGPLSHPLLVEAMETEFVPVAIHNNRPGADAAVLARFDEPSCNYPVVRILGSSGRDLVPRRDGIFDTQGIAARMAAGLEAAHRPVPGYLGIVAEEGGDRLESATFAMGCYWEGEAALGGIEGVEATRTGFLDGQEVVELSFDPERVSYRKLVDQASSLQCATRVYARSGGQLDVARKTVGSRAVRSDEMSREAPAGDQKYYLRNSPLRSLDLTPLQAARVNADLGAGRDPSRWLSPRQRAALTATSAKHVP